MDGGGKRFNKGKPRVELLVPCAMEAEARVWAIGAEKYGEMNWQLGMKWTIVIACILRHTFAILRGEDRDAETGELHAAHIKCNASMLIYYFENYKEGDDRKIPVRETSAIEEDKEEVLQGQIQLLSLEVGDRIKCVSTDYPEYFSKGKIYTVKRDTCNCYIDYNNNVDRLYICYKSTTVFKKVKNNET